MISMRRRRVALAAAAGGAVLIGRVPPGARAAGTTWQPTRNVEIVAPAAAGSALDALARVLQHVAQDQKIVPASISVSNKAGGGNAVGFAYLSGRPADGQTLLITPFTIITNRITGANALNYTDFTPLAMLAEEHVGFVVNASSPLRTGHDLLERLKKEPDGVSMALAAALGNANHIAACLVAKSVGVDPKRLKIAVFNSSGESLTAVLGGHVDLAITTIGLIGPHVEAGRVRVIAVAAPKRLGGVLASVPTWREQGTDVVFSSWRALIGPRGMAPEPLAYWENTLARISSNKEWIAELDKNALVPAFLGSEATRKLFVQQEPQLRTILTELGMAKNP